MADKKISQLTGATTPLAGTEVLPIVQSGSTVKVAVSDLTAGRTVSATKLGLGMSPTYALDVTDNSTGVQSRISSSSSNGTSFAMTNSAANGRTWRIGNNYVIGNGEWSLYDDTASKEVLRADSSQNVRAVQGNFIVGTAAKGIDFSANTHAAGMTSELLNWYEEGTWTPAITFQTPGDLSVTYTTQAGAYTRIGNRVILQGFVKTSAFTHSTASGYLAITGIPFTATNAAGRQNLGALYFQGITKANYTNFVASIEDGAPSLVLIYASGSGQNGDFIDSADMPSGGSVDLRFTLTYQV
jgi:hypothetical protein